MTNQVGAVLVIGDGIGAVQAVLDLANSGFKAYLLSPHPMLSGEVSGVSPTESGFPTNDCELCFLGAELEEVRTHGNVEILGPWELVGFEGEPGDFTARLQGTGPVEGQTQELSVGAAILAPTHKPYDATGRPELGYGRFGNVVTSLDFDRIVRARGKVAWLQCVGSRDREHNYCSAVCCLEATKKAMMALDSQPEAEHHIFMMDMRAFAKGYLDYYNRAREEYGIGFTRCRLGAVIEDPETGELALRYETEEGELEEEAFELVVLSVGMEVSEHTRRMAALLGVDLNAHGFLTTEGFAPAQTSRPGVYVAGPVTQPKDTRDTVTEAGAAVAAVEALLAPARDTLTVEQSYPPERDVSGEPLRVGVFFGQSRMGITPILDIPALTEYARELPEVVDAVNDLDVSPGEWPDVVREHIESHELNRVVVATGTPLTYDAYYRDILQRAGLNPYLLTIVNLREGCAWPHARQPEVARAKARDLLRMAVARAHYLEALPPVEQEVAKSALVIGGGVAGLNAALSLAQQGESVTLIEREAQLGGNVRDIHHDLAGQDVQAYLQDLIAQVEEHPRIEIWLETELVEQSGSVGRFVSTLETPEGPVELTHGVTILAVGGQEYRGPDYGLDKHPDVITQLDLERLLEKSDPRATEAKEIVMVQCVGPGTEYCSRVCCGVAIKHALQLKEVNPDVEIYVLYRDIRAYGFREEYYTQAREEGVLFLRYDDDNLPQVDLEDGVAVTVHEYLLDRDITFRPDLLVLSEGIVPAAGSRDLAETLHLRVNEHGFFIEAHPKLHPVDMANEGIYVCGLAHNPKSIEETIAQAHAAAARASRVLSRERVSLRREIAVVDQAKCTGCLTCVRICPYEVPAIDPNVAGAGEIMGAADIDPATCKGCGLCVGECPAKAIQLRHYRDDQLLAEITAIYRTV